MNVEGYTIKEMAKELGLPPKIVERRIQRVGIKPITREAIYPADTLEAIRNVPGKGRPKQAATPEPMAKTAPSKSYTKKSEK
jgi:hypothetical protein